MREEKKWTFYALWGIVTGFLAGFLGGIAGLGGGVVMVPMLSLVVGLQQHKAHGTSLSAIFVTAAVASLTYGHYGHVPLLLSLVLALFSSLAAFWGARFTRKISGFTLRKWFGWFLVIVALSMALGDIKIFSHGIFKGGIVFWTVVIVTGFLSGFLSGTLGIGGGTLRVPFLVLLLGLPQWSAQGASLFAMIPTSFVGAITHWKMGHVEMKIAPWLWVSISLGALFGGIVAHYLPALVLRRIFAVIVGLIAVREILFTNLYLRRS